MAIVQSFLGDVDFKKNQLINPVIHKDTSFPKTPNEGQLFYLSRNYLNYIGKNLYYYNGSEWVLFGGSGSGSVTSVGLKTNSLDILNISNSPITDSGDIELNFISQNKNLFLASPSNMSGVPLFRSIVYEDLPDLSNYYILNSELRQYSAKFNIEYGIFNKYIEIEDYTPSINSNRLYSIAGTLYWNGSPLAIGGELKKNTYVQFCLNETILNTNRYFTYANPGTLNNLNFKSSNANGLLNKNSIPYTVPFNSIIKKIQLNASGLAVDSLTIEYPVYLQIQVLSMYNTSENLIGVINISINNSNVVGSYNPSNYGISIEQSTSIILNSGSVIGFKFISNNTVYGENSTVSSVKNLFIQVNLEEYIT